MSERDVEIPWALDRCEGVVLDVGCAESIYLNDLGVVDGIDSRPIAPEGLRRFIHGDIRTHPADPVYDTVLALSTLEHVGLEHVPYQTEADDPDGDRHGLEACVRWCKPGGKVLVTVPFGEPGVFGWYRQYDEPSLGRLCDGFLWSAEYVMNPGGWGVDGVALVEVRS